MHETHDPLLEPDADFYRVTGGQLGGAPGDLIDSEELLAGCGAALAQARATYRVLYQSRSGLGDRSTPPNPTDKPIAVSGLIAFPSGEVPVGGWPVLSWAHGTVGSADHAAPSMDPYLTAEPADSGLGLLRKINKAPHALLNAFLQAGWAVAMTDYEGLGTYGCHPYLLGVSEGRGVLDIVPAVRQLAVQAGLPAGAVSDRYAIVGHSQGGQAALWAAHLACRAVDPYPTAGALIGVAALAPASNLTDGLRAAYSVPSAALVGDLGAFYPLFSSGVFGGDPGIDPAAIFQPDALVKYLQDSNTLSRAELSQDPFWMQRPPLAGNIFDRSGGIFRVQTGDAWTRYWAQVDAFNPDLEITVPIRISQAAGDTRVKPANTTLLIQQLETRNGTGSVLPEPYEGGVATPDPATLGEHFGLLVDEREIRALLVWFRDL